MLSEVNSFCLNVGLRLNIAKSAAFWIEYRGKTQIYNKDITLTIDDQRIPLFQPGNTFSYLGYDVDPWTGKIVVDVREQLGTTVARISNQCVSPLQKLEILRTYALPILIYPLSLANLAMCNLTFLDDTVRKTVKVWLSLPSITTGHILYCRTHSGGPSLPKFAKIIPEAIDIRIFLRHHNSTNTISDDFCRFAAVLI